MILNKKICFSLLFASSLAFSSGIPVVDIGSIAQAVKNYEQQIKEYQQMLEDTANFKKQMAELGVDMNSINQIFGDAQSIMQQTQDLYSGIQAVPKDFYGEVEDITKACNFLEKESSFFQTKIQNVGTKYTDKVNACLSAISDTNEIDKTISQLSEKLTSISSDDEKTYNKTLLEIQNLRHAKEFLSSKANQDKINKIIAFYDNYQKNDSTNPYSKAKMDNDLKTLSRQLLKSNNQKQALALSNTILIKILEMMQRQYELNIYLSQALVSLGANQNSNVDYSPNYQTQYEDPKDPKEYNPFLKDVKEQPKDENGFPVFDF